MEQLLIFYMLGWFVVLTLAVIITLEEGRLTVSDLLRWTLLVYLSWISLAIALLIKLYTLIKSNKDKVLWSREPVEDNCCKDCINPAHEDCLKWQTYNTEACDEYKEK
jgi:uncharacterized membrane protein YcgQ (UPF0703/DUF1980 family)